MSKRKSANTKSATKTTVTHRTALTVSEFASQLRSLSQEMETAGQKLSYLGGFNPMWQLHSQELIGASVCVREWADEISTQKR